MVDFDPTDVPRLPRDGGSEAPPPAQGQATLQITRAETPETQGVLGAGQVIGRYRLLRELGRGGMAEVWLAQSVDAPDAVPVALKLPLVSQASAGFLERLERERRILALLDHPRIARLLDAGIADSGQHFMALEFVDGMPLTAYCDRHELSLRSRLKIFGQVLQGVHHAHSRAVLHRDLKPSNILVTPQGQARLLDFGIAKVLIDGRAQETELTAVWGRALTPDYASPEQQAGSTVTAASDIYSLGVILHELVAGQRPRSGRRNAAGGLLPSAPGAQPLPASESCLAGSAVARREGGVRALSRLLAGDLDAIVERALRKDPAERYPDIGAFARDIRKVLKGRPVRSPLQRLGQAASRLARRHLASVSLTSLLMLVIAGLRHSHQAAATLETLLTPTLPPQQQVVLVIIGTQDHQRLFNDRSPLDAAVLQRLVARVLDGGPALLGVDIDTSAPSFAPLRKAFDPGLMGRVVWGRDFELSDGPEATVVPRPVLGANESAPPLRSALAVSLLEGSSNKVRWFQQAVATSQGVLPTMAGTLGHATAGSGAEAQLQRGIRYTRGGRVELPASVVLAPGFDWQDQIRDRVVLIGGLYDNSDLHATPVGPLHGVEVLANAVETQLSGRAYERPATTSLLAMGLGQLTLTLALFRHLGSLRGAAASLAVGLALTLALAASGLFAAWSYAVMVVLAVVANHALVDAFHRRRDDWAEALRRRWQRLVQRRAETR